MTSTCVAILMLTVLVLYNPATAQRRSKNTSKNTSRSGQNAQYGPLLEPQCGVVNTTYTRIVGGVPAKLGAWPWMAVLAYRVKGNRNAVAFNCGGSLISARHVLTAAHCISKDLIAVRLGELDLSSPNDGATPIDIPIEKKTMHPGYSSKQKVNDIAVLRLQVEVQFTPLIKPVCLPTPESIRTKDLVGTYPFVAGWGTTKFQGQMSNALQQVQLPVVSEQSCSKAYGKKGIDSRVVCAGYAKGGKDSCQGDSGGPLMYPLGNTFYQIGVVSWGHKCAEPGYPGIYARTTAYLDFIIPLLK